MKNHLFSLFETGYVVTVYLQTTQISLLLYPGHQRACELLQEGDQEDLLNALKATETSDRGVEHREGSGRLWYTRPLEVKGVRVEG